MAAHDLADHFDVRQTIAGKDIGVIPEVARAQQTRTDDCEETGVNVAAVTESVCVDVKTDGESPDLDRLGSRVRHEW
jgi:acyl-CoA synthetase (NDP forming)